MWEERRCLLLVLHQEADYYQPLVCVCVLPIPILLFTISLLLISFGSSTLNDADGYWNFNSDYTDSIFAIVKYLQKRRLLSRLFRLLQ